MVLELPTEPTPEQQEAHTKRVAEVEQYWAAWWEANQAKWDYSAGEKVGIFFLDTVLQNIGVTSYDWT